MWMWNLSLQMFLYNSETAKHCKRASYRAEVVSSWYLDADWSRRRGEGILIRWYADPHLRRTEQELQCTQGDLRRVTRVTMWSDVLERIGFESCLCLLSQGRHYRLQKQFTSEFCHFLSIWLMLNKLSVDYPCTCCGMWPLTLCCSTVDRGVGPTGSQGSGSMLKKQRCAGHIAPSTSFW